MTGPESRSGLRAPDHRLQVQRAYGRLRSTLVDPVAACTAVVASIPVVAVGALGSVVWKPLAVVTVAWGIYWYPRWHRMVVGVRDAVARSEQGDRAFRLQLYGVVVALGIVVSIPIAQAFFANDLRAMAAPTISAVEARAPDVDQTIPPAIYGDSPTVPSYWVCSATHYWTNSAIAWPCYSSVGYLRLWQMRAAFPTVLGLTLLVAALPLALMWHVRPTARV